MRGVHVALAVHHLVQLPVDDGATGHTYLEHVGVRTHEVGGHETAKRPAVYANAVGINVGERLEELDALELVLHLDVAKVAVGAALKLETAIFGTAVVNHKDDVAALCHVYLPGAGQIVPRCLHIVGVRATIHIDYCGVLFGRVEADGLYKAVVEVGFAIGSLDFATADFGHIVGCPRVGIGVQLDGSRGLGGAEQVVLAEGGGRRPAVGQVEAVL